MNESRVSTRVSTLDVDDHPHWSEPAHDLPSRFALGWIATTWLMATAIAAVLSAIAIYVIAVTADPFADGRSGVATIVAGLATFVAFVFTLRSRVCALQEDRLLNSLAVAAMHVLVAGVAIALGVLVAGDQIGMIPDGFQENLGIVTSALERSSAVAILAALLIPGIVPATGATPAGTQVEPTAQDRQL